MERLNELISKKFLTMEELEELEYMEEVSEIENLGNSGQYFGYLWYNVKTFEGCEYSVYC